MRRFEEAARGMLASRSVRVSEMAAALPPSHGRLFHQAKALYRFLSNPRVGWEGILQRVCEESTAALGGGEVLVLLDLSPVSKPYARALEGLGRVGKGRRPGYELLTALALDPEGRLALGYAHLVAYREKGFVSLPREVEKAVEGVRGRIGGRGRRLVYVADRGFDDRKVFSQVLGLGEDFVIRVYRDRKVGEGVSLREAVASLPLASRGEVRLKLGGRYQRVGVRLGWREVEGRRLGLVVCRVPALGRRGEWWLLTSLPVRGREDALRVVEVYRKRWEVEGFFRFLKAGLGLESFQVRGLLR
ncbi:transposase, partial [Thermus tengchongensis]